MLAPTSRSHPTSRSVRCIAHRLLTHGPRRPVRRAACVALGVAALLVPHGAAAQQLDSVRAGVQRAAPDVPDPAQRPRRERAAAAADSAGPPITPRRAFLYSLLVPGAGQAKLDRGYAGGMFFLIEVSALVLVHRSAEDYRIARRFSGDSIPLRYAVDAVTGRPVIGTDAKPQVAAWSVPRYDAAYARTRRLHYEDWLAVMVFNHLFAGADAFVAAQLWDLPTRVGVRASPVGTTVQASIAFR